MALSIVEATVSLTVNGEAIDTSAAAWDGFTAPNYKSGYLTSGNGTINFLCPDLNGALTSGGGTSATPAPASSSPAIEPSGSPSASSSP